MALHTQSYALVRRDDDGPVVLLSGDIDLAAVADVRLSIGEAMARGADPLVFDLGDVSFIDSSGLGVLLRASQHTSVVLRSVPDQVRNVLAISAVEDRFVIEG